MTDIYDFRHSLFTTHKKQWTIMYKAISKHCKIIGDVIELQRYFNFFKKYKPDLWNNCSDEIIMWFIFRIRQIVHHEQIYLPGKEPIKDID